MINYNGKFFQTMDYFELLPDEIVLKIMEYLLQEEALGAFWTCKRFANIISSSNLSNSKNDWCIINADTSVVCRNSLGHKLYGLSRHAFVNDLLHNALRGSFVVCNPLLADHEVLSVANTISTDIKEHFTYVPPEFSTLGELAISPCGEIVHGFNSYKLQSSSVYYLGLLIHAKKMKLKSIRKSISLPPNLTELSIIKDHKNIKIYDCPKSLEVLRILYNCCSTYPNIVSANLINLKYLEMDVCYSYIDLEKFRHVQKIVLYYNSRIYNCWYYEPLDGPLQNLSMSSHIFKNLTELEVTNNYKIRDIKPLSYIKKLTFNNCRNLNVIEDMHDMELLRFTDCNISVVRNLSNIGKLRLRMCNQVRRIYNLTSIGCVNLSICGRVSMIDNWRTIGIADLHICPQLTDRTKLEDVREVKLSKCDGLTSN